MSVEVFTKNGKTLTIIQDEFSDSPREMCEPLGTMACFHKRYTLGDKHHHSIEEATEIENSDKFISLPLYLYGHSGITMSTTPFSCPWDSGKVGIIYVSKEKIRKEYNWKVITKKRLERIEGYLSNEVKEYDYYLTGRVYGYKITDENGEEIDSCYGFYGEDWKENGLFDNAGWEA